MDKLPSNKNISKPKDDDDKCISATIASILDKICSSEINTKSSTYLPFHFIIAENQCLATDENKQILERSLPSNTSTCTATNASSICPVAAAQSSSNSCPQTTTKNINCANSRTITLQRMGKQPTPVAKILPRKSAPSNKPKLVLLHQPPSTNESGKNVNLQQQFPQASISGISSCSLISTNSAKSFSENKIKNLTTPKTFLTSIYPPSVKINTTKLVAISTPACSNSSSSHIVLPTSITPTTKNIPTTSCGSLTTTPKTVFTLKTGPISSIGGINDNNKSIKTTISSSLSSPAITTSVHPPLCLTPPRNKKSPMKRPNQLVTTTISNNGISKLYGDSKMSSINSTKFSSSSPLLDSNDLLTNTVNKVASGADISPTNQEENASLITTKTSTQTTDLTINKPKQTKKKAPIKPKILVDEQKNKGNGNTCNNKNTQNTKIQPVVSSISPQIFGASPPQAQTTLFPLESSVAETITTSTAVVFNSTGQTFPSTGMLLPNSQFALASNGNLASVSNNGMTHYLIRQPSAVGNSGGQQQFVQLMSPPIFLSPMQQIDSSGQVIQQQFDQQNQQGTSPTKFTPTNLMSARNVLFHTGNGIFMPMISNQNIVGIPQSQPFLPTTTSATNLTSISSQNPASSKFVFQLAKPTTTTNIMPNILPKISSKGKTTTATIVSTITTNTTATPEAMVIVSSSPSIQPAFINNGNFIFTNPQMQQQFQQKQLLPFLEGENVFNNNQQQFLQQLFNAQQQNIGGNLFISNNNEENKSEKKIEEGKKPTRTRKKKGEVVAGDTSTSDIELQKQQKMPHFDGMTTAIILQHGQQQGFDEEENEPPPVLCRGEITSVPPSTGTKSIENVFQKEAKIIREKMFDSNGKKYGPIVHDIDGFRIEEDVDPFPCEHQKLLEKLVIDENVVKKQQQKDGAKTTNKNGNQVTSPTEESTSNKNFSAESNTSKTKKRQRKQSSSSSEGAEERSSSFSKSPPIRKLKKMSKVEDKPKQVGRRRELENLLKMDFGPGKTPFQTSDPDEYAEEVLGGRKRTLALAAEEISARKSMDRPGSSTKKRDKEKSFSLTSTTSVTLNEKHEKNEPRRSDESIEEGRCSYCRRPFSEVGRDKEHEQYCSKDCRRMKKYEKRKQQQQKALLNEGNKASSSLNVGNEKQGNASTTPLEGNNNINSTKIRPSIQSPPSSLQNSSTPDNVKTIKPKMTSPQGSAFSTLQPQMFATNNTTILLNKKWPTTTSLDEQAAQLVQKQIGEQIASIAKGFEVQSSSSSGDEQQLPYGAPLNLIPQVTSQQMIASLPLQQQQQLFASHFLPQQAYLSGQDSNNFSFLQHSQSPPTQIPSLTPQLVMPPNNNTNTFFASQQFRQQQQNPTTSHLFLQSPTNTPTPTGNGNNEKNAEIEALVAKSIYTWTSEDVSRWVNFITNSESNGERFIQQEIDGSSLVLLTCEQLQNELKLKLGPAVKLNNALSALKARQPYL